MIRVAILGGTGFAGRNIREELSQAGHTVRAFSRTTGCDMLDVATLWRCLDEFLPTHIVNCAAVVGSINFVSDFAADVVDSNMRMLLNLYKVAQQMREVIVINPIANCAYPGDLDVYDEQSFWSGMPHRSVLSYGSTRRMMHVLSLCYAAQYGVRTANLIVPNMYGPYDSTNPNKTHALNALCIKFVQAMKQRHAEIEVWGTGAPIREWLYVRDFARVVRDVVESGQAILEPVNIAQNTGYSVRELVNELVKITNYTGKIAYNTKYQDGAMKKVMDDRQFAQRFPEFKFTPFEQGLAETVEYYKEIL